MVEYEEAPAPEGAPDDAEYFDGELFYKNLEATWHLQYYDGEWLVWYEEPPKNLKKITRQASPLKTQKGGAHYKDFKIQPVQFISENNIGFLEGNVIKYVCRHEKKNGLEDIEKAIHYLELIKEMRYGK